MNSHLVRQADFSGGEIAPLAYGRTDSPAYQHGLRTALNFIPTMEGQLLNRPGTRFVAYVKDFSYPPRLIEFSFTDGQTFILEIGDQYIRIIQNGAILAAVITGAVPWLIADVMRLKYAQSGDVITVTHPKYPPQEISRISNLNWTVTPVSFAPQSTALWMTVPTSTQRAAENALAYNAANTYVAGNYVNDGQFTYICLATNGAGAAKTPSTSPTYWAVAIDAAHPVKDWSWVVTQVYSDSLGRVFETAASPAYTASVALYTDRPAVITWTIGTHILFPYILLGQNVYRGRNGIYGFVALVGIGPASSYKDDGSAPDFSVQPPRGTNPFDVATGANTPAVQSYPGAVTYHEQRIVYARSDKKPQDFWGSAIGKYKTFDVNTPVQQSDAYNFKPNSDQLEEIRNLLSLRYLLLFTSGGVWGAYGGVGAISASSINLRRYSQQGASYLWPLGVERAALYQTSRGRIRDLNWEWRSDMYGGHDVSVVARHLLEGHNIVDWCYAETPYSIVWAVREDGVLLSLTYSPTGIEAWAQHTTAGTFERVAAVIETDPVTGVSEDAVYVVVRRIVGGSPVRYIERFSTRILPLQRVTNADGTITSTQDVRLTNFLDASIQVDGRNVTPSAVMSIAQAGQVVALPAGSQQILANPVGVFSATDVGLGFVLTDPLGNDYRATCISYTDASHITVEFETPVPLAQALLWQYPLGTTTWGRASKTIAGLSHLNGLSVNALVDGGVQGPFIPIGGQINLATAGVIVQVGLSYNSDMELLDIGADQFKTNVSSARKITFELVSSRGLLIGETLDDLTKLKSPQLQTVAGGNAVPPLITGNAEIASPSSWNVGARAGLRQVDPLPLTVVAVVREVVLGGR